MRAHAERISYGRKRPISLEGRAQTPDDRKVLGNEEPHPEGMESEESIESLAGDEGNTRADHETPDPAEPVQGEPSDENDLDAIAELLGNETLGAMESVEENAQSLIEDAIDSLLDSADNELPEPPAALDIESLTADPETPMSSEDIDAQLDALTLSFD